jgi:glycosyltransferase involved in cell wall biosynthesis
MAGPPPLVTIGIVSYNRLHYLRALVASARTCIQYPSVQWILVDGGSTERGLQEYLESLDFLDHLVSEPCTHAEAMNRIVALARGEYLMLLPEDVQFVVRGPWLADLVEVAAKPRVGHVVFDAQRRVTIERYFSRLLVKGRLLPRPLRRPYRRYRTSSGQEFLGYGWTRDGIGGPGIMTFGRKAIWDELGPWRAVEELATLEGSDLGAEGDMLRRYRASRLRLELVLMRRPVCADVVTDPRGTKARVRRGNRRYGRYSPPVGELYYRIWEQDELARFAGTRPAVAFEDVVRPIGFELPLDERGNLLKTSVIGDDEPYELVDQALST